MKKMTRKTTDRRKSQRLKIPIQIRYKLLPHKRVLEETLTQNVSGGGMGLRLSQPLRKNDKLKVFLNFPTDPKPITAISEVTWCKKESVGRKGFYKAGIKHIKIVPKDKERFVFLFCEMMINYLTVGRIA